MSSQSGSVIPSTQSTSVARSPPAPSAGGAGSSAASATSTPAPPPRAARFTFMTRSPFDVNRGARHGALRRRPWDARRARVLPYIVWCISEAVHEGKMRSRSATTTTTLAIASSVTFTRLPTSSQASVAQRRFWR